MSISLQKVQTLNTACTPFLNRLKTIYAAMDSKYHEAADYYGFKCTGCEDNCCLTRFYHHTLLEYSYILKGFATLDKEKQTQIKQRAAKVCRKTALADEKGEAVRLMCPLNFDGLCLLYAFRPMICRLFGIAHELQQPGMGIIRLPGGEACSKQILDKSYFKFDRTPFFIEMAMLEKEFKHAVGVNQKFKMTVAQMLETF